MRRGDFTRWLYRGQRPNWIARMEKRAWAALFSSGLLSNSMVTLEVTGRTSGRTVALPVAVTVVNGERYLVSMPGKQVQWVHHVRAAGGRAVLHRHGREEVHLEEVPAEQRAPILKAYLQRAPGARPMCLCTRMRCPQAAYWLQKECTPPRIWPDDGAGVGDLNPTPAPEIESTGRRSR